MAKKGKDLSALKARLAKKAADDAAPAEAPAAARVAAPGELPAPGQVAAPPPEPEPEPEPAADAAPFHAGAAAAASFDPNAGLFEGADEAPKKGAAGMIIGAVVVALGLGIPGGYVLSGQMARGKIVGAGQKGGKTNLDKVQGLAEIRGRIGEAIGPVKQKLSGSPEDIDAGAGELAQLLTDNFQEIPKVEELYGWQLASLDPGNVAGVFTLYEQMNGFVIDLGTLAGFVNANAKVLGGGPKDFAVRYTPGGAVLVEFSHFVCDEKLAEQCAAGEESKATGMAVRETLGGNPTGYALTEVARLDSGAPVHVYAINEQPENNSKVEYERLSARLDTRLASMGDLEAKTVAALQAFANSPTVDDASRQPGSE